MCQSSFKYPINQPFDHKTTKFFELYRVEERLLLMQFGVIHLIRKKNGKKTPEDVEVGFLDWLSSRPSPD